MGKKKRKGNKKPLEKLMYQLNDKVNNHERFQGWELSLPSNFEYTGKKQYIDFVHKDGYKTRSMIETVTNTNNGLRIYHASIPELSIHNIMITLRNKKSPYKIISEQLFINREVKLTFWCDIHSLEFDDYYYKVIEREDCCPRCFTDKRLNARAYQRAELLTSEDHIPSSELRGIATWRKTVVERDDFTCQCCGRKTDDIVAHHLDGYHWCVEGRLDVDNGVTLCQDCHAQGQYAFHRLYDTAYNTVEQYREWLVLYQQRIINSVAIE